MTYYEELGISPLAGEEEVRRAHRLLTRILHPDQQTDELLQRLAGLQLRRINLIVECLLNPVSRREYDASLQTAAPPVPPPTRAPLPRAPLPQSFWRLATVALLAGFALAAVTFRPQDPWPALAAASVERPEFQSGDPAKRSRLPEEPVKRPRLRPIAELPAKPAEPRSPRPAPAASPVIIDPVQRPQIAAAGIDERTDPASSATTPGSLAQPPDAKPAESLPPSSKPPATPLTGTWIYAPKTIASDSSKLYRPEYIELKIQSDDGAVFGQYKGRYVIPDRPISPTVAFQFSGKFSGTSGSFPWKSSGSGSAGQVELKLLSERTLQVDWKATQVSDSLGLVSGTAVLIRRN